MNSLKHVFLGLTVVGLTTYVAAADKAAKPDAAAMAHAQAQMAPGPNHQILQRFVGTWNVTSKMWMSTKDKPEVSQGMSVNSLIYGGRFLKQDYKGTAMGQPFEGVGYYGYDNVKDEYVSVWLDNIATALMTSTGHYDAASKTLKDSGTMSCPMNDAKDMPYRTEWKIVDDDHNVYSMYTQGPDGQEYKAMELTFTRAK